MSVNHVCNNSIILLLLIILQFVGQNKELVKLNGCSVFLLLKSIKYDKKIYWEPSRGGWVLVSRKQTFFRNVTKFDHFLHGSLSPASRESMQLALKKWCGVVECPGNVLL